jgi:hypothetical protein
MRRQPVAFALIDAAFLADSKFRGLRRRLPDPGEFNSAVGAWLIVLTSARRNGLPQVDAEDEAEDSTYLPDLIAVGLLTEEGIPEGPFKAWAPARPKYPSDVAPSAPDAPKVTNAPSSPFPPPNSASTPFTSTLIPSSKGPREVKNSVDRNPELRAQREAIVARYGHGMDETKGPA